MKQLTVIAIIGIVILYAIFVFKITAPEDIKLPFVENRTSILTLPNGATLIKFSRYEDGKIAEEPQVGYVDAQTKTISWYGPNNWIIGLNIGEGLTQ